MTALKTELECLGSLHAKVFLTAFRTRIQNRGGFDGDGPSLTVLPRVVSGETFFRFCIAVEPLLSFIVNVFRVRLFFVLKFPILKF